MIDRLPLKDAALGRWRGILPELGLPAKMLNGKHGPCPFCGGTDRFRFDDKEGRGTWICNECGAGDGISFVMKMHKVDYKGAAELIEPLIGVARYRAPSPEHSPEKIKAWLNDLWKGSRAITPSDPAGVYLRSRAGLDVYPRDLRFHESISYREKGSTTTSRWPGMLARVTDAVGRPGSIHRTYLTERGEKAPLAKPRALMPGELPLGAAVRLAPVAETLGIAEGIETALAAGILHGIPCWAAIATHIMAKWEPPEIVKRVVVFGDCDQNYAGQHAAYQLANRLAVKRKLEVEVRIPPKLGEDWDNVLAHQRAAA